MSNRPPVSWSTTQRRLHWLVAFGVLFDFALSWVMTRVGDDQALLKFALYGSKNAGVFVLAGVVRAHRVAHVPRRPALPADLSDIHKRLALTGHAVLYALLVLVPVLGYLTNSTSPSRIPVLLLLAIPLPNLTPASEAWFALLVQLHRLAAIALFVTALAHALIAVVHHRRGCRFCAGCGAARAKIQSSARTSDRHIGSITPGFGAPLALTGDSRRRSTAGRPSRATPPASIRPAVPDGWRFRQALPDCWARFARDAARYGLCAARPIDTGRIWWAQ